MRINAYAPSDDLFKVNFANSSDESQKSESTGASFADVLKNSLDSINDKQVESNSLTDSLVKGDENVDITDVMLSSAEADMSLQYAVQVRNKLVDAYQEITKMQI